MCSGSNTDDLRNQIIQENLSKLFISAVFDALKAQFGEKAAKRYLKNDLDVSLLPDGVSVDVISKSETPDKNWTIAPVSDAPVDLFRETYNRIFPRTVRHALGEYYTPPWLADRILDSVSYCQYGFESLLDPCCGSGVFLLQGLKRLLRRASQEGKAVTASLIVQNLIGRDVNPVSVFACKANLRINVYRLTGLVLPNRLENVQCADFLKENSQSNNLSSETYDIAAGNPPWIAWDNLSADYRRETESLWRRYNLFHLTGSAARHGGAKKDLSELIFYASCDRLKSNGRIGFVLPKSLFFTLAAGGFRRWTLPDGEPVKIESVEDFSRLNLFGTPAAKACVVTASKGAKTQYPVKYTEIHSIKSAAREKASLSAAPQLREKSCWAQPSDPANPLSVWSVSESRQRLSVPSIAISNKDNLTSYIARLGANSGGANGVYWLTILDVVDQSRVRVRNQARCSKKNIPEVEAVIESALLYPLARWKSVSKGALDLDETVILVVQDPIKRTGMSRKQMETKYPLALNYLLQFEELLSSRAAQKRFQSRGEFYSMYNVGQYTFSDWKCVWRRMDSRIRAAAVGPRSVAGLPQRPVFPQETCVFIPAQSESEACYLSAIMNSSAVNALACSTSCVGGKSFGSPNLISRIPLVQFDANNPVHAQLADLGRLLSQTPDDERVQKEIDRLTPDGAINIIKSNPTSWRLCTKNGILRDD